MLLVLCNLLTGEEEDYLIFQRDIAKLRHVRSMANTHRIWETKVISFTNGIYEISEDYYFLVLSGSEIDHIRKAQKGDTMVHHLEYKLRSKNILTSKGKITSLGYRILRVVSEFDKSNKKH